MKQKITFEETVKFEHEIEIEVKNQKAADAVDVILSGEFDCLDTAAHFIGRVDGVKIIDVCHDDSGQSSEMVCTDVCDMAELEAAE